MIHKRLACLAAAAVIGAALMAVPAQARFGGGGFGGMHGGMGGFGGMHAGIGGFGGMHGAGFGGARVGGFGGGFGARSGFVGRSAFINHGFFPGRRFAFFGHRRFFGPFFGFGVGALYASTWCWTWVPTAWGWQRVWACDY
jgi:hypothetical protein